ncbi:MAG: hypothetical protein Q7T20_06240 [Saprospiraceae bacterium]|nr:hypothetical protein [Saprospiraceae bacterium]
MKYLAFLLSIACFLACSQSPKNTGDAPKNESYTTFKFSNAVATIDARDPENWCVANIGEAALISADPKNFNRRLFALGDVPARVIIDYGHQSASFMLYKTGNQVEIFTSDNFPICLSNKANFQISPEGISFRYNNKMDINIEVDIQELPGGLQVVLNLPLNSGHGISVFNCKACN